MQIKKMFRLSLIFAATLIAFTLGVVAPAQATSCITGGNPVTQGQLVDNAVYTICDYRGFDFHGLHASNVDFQISYLAGANFENANFPGIIIANNTNHSVNFRGAIITGSDFRFADLGLSDFTGAQLDNSDIHFGHFEGAIFENADFSGANMNNSFFAGANLTGATVTQAQLASAVLSDTTVCPDGEPLGLHVDDCFSALRALTPILSSPTLLPDGFTFTVTNYDEYYTFTASVTAGPGVASIGSPTGTTLPITVTGAPPGSDTQVTVTSQIGNVSASSVLNYQEELAKTGMSPTQLWALGLLASSFIVLGVSALIVGRLRKF
jgi:hypothetical protein